MDAVRSGAACGALRGCYMGQIRVLIVDDHTVVRDGLNTMLSREGDFVVVGEAGDGEDAIAKNRDLDPEVILTHISQISRVGAS